MRSTQAEVRYASVPVSHSSHRRTDPLGLPFERFEQNTSGRSDRRNRDDGKSLYIDQPEESIPTSKRDNRFGTHKMPMSH